MKVHLVPKTNNKKTGKVAATYITGDTWPDRTPAEFPTNFVPNASCETPEELEKATANGWDTVLVATGEEDELIGQKVAGKRVIVCPNQSRGVTCAECKLCMKRDRAVTIAFLPHGAKNKIGLAVASKR